MFAYEICGVQFSIVCLFLNGVTKAVQANRIPRDSGQIIIPRVNLHGLVCCRPRTDDIQK